MRRVSDLPLTARLLGIGLPLSILAGTALAVLLFPSLPIALAGLIGASLAPTDAALSASVIADERLPIGVRRVLNVESGLNDGIATPVVTLFIAAAATALGVVRARLRERPRRDRGAADRSRHRCRRRACRRASRERVLTGARLDRARFATAGDACRWHSSRSWSPSEVGGNPFVAAFIGGLVFGASATDRHGRVRSSSPSCSAACLSLVLWFVFGAGFVLPAFEHLDGRVAVYAVPASRRADGAGGDLADRFGPGRATISFVGWFGPRGLASVVFALLALEEFGGADPRVITVVRHHRDHDRAQRVAHGITARPFATRYVGSRHLTRRRSA